MKKDIPRLELIKEDEQPTFPNRIKYATRLRELGYEGNAQAFEKAIEIAEAMRDAGGRALFVGGSVRDTIAGNVPKDFDLEVYGLKPDEIKSILLKMGEITEAGKQFAVIKFHVLPGYDVDVSVPRKDSKAGKGHSDVDVELDPNMSIQEAARRRDFTMNSLAADPFTGEIYDYYGGVDDIRHRILRATDKVLFKDDALRVMRAVQFVGRLGLQIEPETLQLIQETIPDLKNISKERFLEEWGKMLLKSEKPSIALTVGMTLGVFQETNPELVLLQQTPQEPDWHPEGNVWIHTLMVVDEAAKIVRREQLNDDEAFIILLAALCHDFGKPLVTETSSEGRIISHKHEAAGEEPTKKFLTAIGVPEKKKDVIVKLVMEHLAPSFLYLEETVKNNPIKDGAIRRLATRLHPATVQQLVLVCEADHMGRGSFEAPELKEQLTLNPKIFEPGEWLLERAKKLEIQASKPANLTNGKDWAVMGFKQGISIGQLIRLSNDLRDDKGLTKEEVFKLVIDCKKAEEAVEILEKELMR